MAEFARNFAEPAQLCAELGDHQLDHPYGFVMAVADFAANVAQSGLLFS